MSQFDSRWFSQARKELASASRTSSLFLWWEAKLRGTVAHLFQAQAQQLWGIGEDDYDWSALQDDEWLHEASPEEVKAYVRGARRFAELMIYQWDRQFGKPFEETAKDIDRRQDIETRIRDYLAGEAGCEDDPPER